MKRIVKKTAAALLAFTLTAAVFPGAAVPPPPLHRQTQRLKAPLLRAQRAGNWKRLRPPASWSSALRVPTRRSPTTMTAAS